MGTSKRNFWCVRFFLSVLLLLSFCFISCTKTNESSDDTSSAPITIAGTNVRTATFENTRVRCSFADKQSRNFDVSCFAVTVDANGVEAKATAIADGLSFDWQTPFKLSGADISEISCSVDAARLSQQCALKISSGDPSLVQTDLKIFDRNKQSTKVESDAVYLPLRVSVLGKSIETPIEFDEGASNLVSPSNDTGKFGFEPKSFDPKQELFYRSGSVVSCGTRIYFRQGKYIYVIEGDKSSKNGRIFAGNPSDTRKNDFSHRLRHSFGDNLYLACGKLPKELYVVDSNSNQIVKLSDEGPVVVIANEKGEPGDSDDGVSALESKLLSPTRIDVTPAGEFVFIESFTRIRKIDTKGILSTVIRNVAGLERVAAAKSGMIYFSTVVTYSVFEVSPAGTVRRIAGTGVMGWSGDNGPALEAKLGAITGLSVAPDNSVIVSCKGTSSDVIRRIDPQGIITHVAGTGGDGLVFEGTALQANLGTINALHFSTEGSLTFSNKAGRVSRMSSAGEIVTVAGGSLDLIAGEGRPTKEFYLPPPTALATMPDGAVLIVEAKHRRIRRIAKDGTIYLFAGNGGLGSGGDYDPSVPGSGAATEAQFNHPTGIVTTSNGTVYISDRGNNNIRRIDANGIITTIAGKHPLPDVWESDDANNVELIPTGLALEASGAILVSDLRQHRIVRIDPSGRLTTAVGLLAQPGFSGDGGLALNAQINSPFGIAVGTDGSIFFADTGNSRIRKVSPAGIISTVAGGGTPGVLGDGGPATQADFGSLGGVHYLAADPDGRIFLSDKSNKRVRILERVPSSDSYKISTFLGEPNKRDCGGGVIRKTISNGNMSEELGSSVSAICFRDPMALSIRNDCSAPEPTVTFLIGQSLNGSQVTEPNASGNIIAIRRPCSRPR